jgi:hypothetical protein
VCLGIEPTLWTFDQILLPFQDFGSGICCLVSVGRPLWREAGSAMCQSHFTADSQSVSQSVSQYVLVSSPLRGRLTRYYFLFKCLGLKSVVLSLWGALSDDRPGLSFVSHNLVICLRVYLLFNFCFSHIYHIYIYIYILYNTYIQGHF